MDGKLIDQYASGGEKVSMAIRGLTDEDLHAVPVPGKWSTHQVVIHLADAEAAFADRIRRIIAHDSPPLLAWDENKFAAKLHYEEQDAHDAVAMIDLTRRQMARILRKLPGEAFGRAGIHDEAGRMTVADIVAKANSHLDHHLHFIYEKREKLGKSMW